MLSMRILFSRKNLQVLFSIVLFQTSQTILEQNQLQKNKFSFFLNFGKGWQHDQISAFGLAALTQELTIPGF